MAKWTTEEMQKAWRCLRVEERAWLAAQDRKERWVMLAFVVGAVTGCAGVGSMILWLVWGSA